MPEADLEFLKTTIFEVCGYSEPVAKSEVASSLKIKKWTPEDVGRLLFCLWQMHSKH